MDDKVSATREPVTPEMIAAVRSMATKAELERDGFSVYPARPPFELSTWRAILATLQQHKRAMAALKICADAFNFADEDECVVACSAAADELKRPAALDTAVPSEPKS